jgi:hypothetical protein
VLGKLSSALLGFILAKNRETAIWEETRVMISISMVMTGMVETYETSL